MHHRLPHNSSSSQHNYGTRIRKNSILKPSARLRQSPPSPHPLPRRIKPVTVPPTHHPIPLAPDLCFPDFPIPGVMLHPEDASNKVFHAIGRSFLSVENRAMTIKDLAEMTLKYGLMCQNVSAASQAITTYIRNHMARCEAQQDHPLLLRHVLSGTIADDNLVPALYSRIGGATNSARSNLKDLGLSDKNVANVTQSPLEGGRLTNFRRGTMVWYLSKAAGVSCPFARAGIRLCEYGKEGRQITEKHGDGLQTEPKIHANRDEAQCGEKRKRLRRGCRRHSDGSRERSSVGRDSESPVVDSGYGELGADSGDDERPPKVKLTLRLRPSLPRTPTPATGSRSTEVIDLSNDVTGSSSEDDDASVDDGKDADILREPPEAPWSLPPYPRRSISVPRYTPTCDERGHSPSFSAQRCAVMDERRRSPSIPCSASPPPDSDHDDFDLDLDSDVDWDSSSLSIPSPTPALRVKVETTDDLQPFKHEPADIRDMLDAWEDLDCAPTSTVSSATVKLPTTDDFKFDTLELWEWEFEGGWPGTPEDYQDLPVVKMEPDEHECLASLQAFAPGFPVSPYSPSTSSSHCSLSSPSSDFGVGSLTFQSPLSPSPSSFPIGADRGGCALTWQDAELLGPDSVHPHEFEDEWVCGTRMHVDCNLAPQLASDEAVSSSLPIESEQGNVDDTCAVVEKTGTCHESTVPPLHSSSVVTGSDVIVVRTCRPCFPDVFATQIEGISVYQTMLGSTLLLRRIDTDFVNLSTILCHLSMSPPSPLPDACVNVSHPSLSIDGIWAPLSVARLYSRGLPEGIESVFLSNDLVMRFPTALQDFYQKSTSGRLLNQFGPNFTASLCSPGAGHPLDTPQCDHTRSAKEVVWEVSIEAVLEESLLAIPPSVNLALAALHPPTATAGVTASPETPLSPTEEEMFRTLCVYPDWETEALEGGVTGSGGKADITLIHNPPRERSLRRSRRVANAVAARSRVVPPRTKGPRHS